MSRLSSKPNIHDHGFLAGAHLSRVRDPECADRMDAKLRGSRAMELMAAEHSTHLADLKAKATALLDYQRATGIASAPAGYHALIRSLAMDLLARSGT